MVSKLAEWKFLATTAVLVAMMGVPTLASLTGSPVEESPHRALLAPKQRTRSPASLPGLSTVKKPLVITDTKNEIGNVVGDASSIHFDLRCAKAMAHDFHVDGAYVQMRGKDCSKGNEPAKINVVNKTNGFTASVFMLDSKEYQTDLIQLKDGDNQISVQYENSSGQSQEFTLIVKAKAL